MIKINNDIGMLERLTAAEERGKNNTRRIDEHDKEIKDINRIVASIKELALEIKYMRKDLTDIAGRLKELEDMPKNRWNEIIKTMITVLVTALTTFILIKLGIG